MILINSAAYINSDLVSEFGKLPPALLPVQNKRLYEHQAELLKNKWPNEVIYMTFPQSYSSEMSEYDKIKLAVLGIAPIYIQDDLNLGQAIVYTLNCLGKYDENLIILHGDTLFDELFVDSDGFSCSDYIDDNYHWDKLNDKVNTIFTGYFIINNQYEYIRQLTMCNYDFIQATINYMKVPDAKAVHLKGWKDFGHINTYYRSISKMTTERSFNSLKVVKNCIMCKSSTDINKMEAEQNWFNTIPEELQCYTPKMYNHIEIDKPENKKQYCMEYMYLPSLANLFVFGKNPAFVWKDIIGACKDYIDEEYVQASKPFHTEQWKKHDIVSQNDKMYYHKTLKRLKDTDIDLQTTWKINGVETPSIQDILTELDNDINKNDQGYCSIVHGDFCFSNILYDFKSKSIKVIDPRGRDTEGNLSIYGDIRYEVAKLAHSVLGMYDFIIAGRYYYYENGKNDVILKFEDIEELEKLQQWFVEQKFGDFTFDELDAYIIMIHLFLSMIPLHSDRPDRQKVFLANALRLYVEYKNK